jgi:ABC-type transport system involved in cytochrome bd biosynthesis fused ATPase/permease subunit
MHIVALAWIYVVFMMAVTEPSVVAGIATFVLYGLFPLSIILYLTGTRQRNRRRTEREKLRRSLTCAEETAADENSAKATHAE